jgi:hypothetical protein
MLVSSVPARGVRVARAIVLRGRDAVQKRNPPDVAVVEAVWPKQGGELFVVREAKKSGPTGRSSGGVAPASATASRNTQKRRVR